MSACTVRKFDDKLEGGNQILGTFPVLCNSSISFSGENNILFCEEGVKISNSKLSFQGSNSLIFLSSNRHNYLLNVAIYNDSTLFIGTNNYMNGKLNMILSEGKNIVIGNDGLFSFEIWIRLAAPHLIYDIDTKSRINNSQSVFIGDHVWIGQNALLLKGTSIGSGSILGAMSVLTGERVPLNTIWAGVPAKQIKQGIFWLGNCVHSYRPEDTEKVQTYDSDEFVFNINPAELVDIEALEQMLAGMDTVEARLTYMNKKFRWACPKNRFYV